MNSGKSRFQKSIDIGAKEWPTREIYWLPSDINFLNENECRNDFCGYKSTRKYNVDIHEVICKAETEVIAKELI